MELAIRVPRRILSGSEIKRRSPCTLLGGKGDYSLDISYLALLQVCVERYDVGIEHLEAYNPFGLYEALFQKLM